MNQNSNLHPLRVAPWVIVVILFIALGYVGYSSRESNPFTTNARKLELVSSLRSHLLEVIEAEKNAVVAVAEQDTASFAAQARQAATSAEGERQALEAIIGKEAVPADTTRLQEFTVCWNQFRQLDDEVIGLATQSTNHRARRLSATQCVADMQDFETHLRRFAQDPGQDSRRAVLAYEAFMTHTAEVLRLSRLNTNVRSAELTLGKSRLVSSECRQTLDILGDSVKRQQTGGTR